MRRALLVSSIAALAWAGAAAAQEAAPEPPPERGGIEEITITAEKRETNLQETPVAVTAITGDTIAEQGLEDFGDVQFIAPALVYGEIADMAQITMRGIGVDTSTIDAEPGVGLYQDGVYRGGLTSSAALFFDVERIEVLRGPQGTLYGRNTTGGALNVLTRLPGESFAVDAEALYGSYNRRRLFGAVDVPLVEGLLAVRGAFAYDERDGYTDNLFTGNDEDDGAAKQAKLAAVLTPTEALEVALRFNWITSDYGGPPFVRTFDVPAYPLFISATNPGGVLGALPGIPAGVPFSSPDPRNVVYDQDQEYTRDAWDLNATVTWDVTDDVTLKWIAGYLDLEQDLNPANNDGVTLRLLEGDYEQFNEEWQQELNLSGTWLDGRLDWIAGFFWYESDIAEVYRYQLPDLQLTYEWLFSGIPGCAPTPTGPTTATPSNCLALFGQRLDGTTSPVPFLQFSLDQELASWAIFTQETFHVSDRFRVTAGFRWSKDVKDILHRQVLNLDPSGTSGCGTLANPAVRLEEEWSEPTGKVAADFDVSDDAMAYASYSRGFKSGGYNVGNCGNTYDPEFVNAYELGFKSSWLDNTVRLNVAAFYNDYSDYQARQFVNNASLITNAADAETYGIEIESTWVPLDALRLDLNVSYLTAQYKRFIVDDPMASNLGTIQCPPPAPIGELCQNAQGNALPRAPEWKVGAAAQYDLDLGDVGGLSLRGEYAFTDTHYHDVFESFFARQDSYSTGNLRMIWTAPDRFVSGLSLQAFVENIGDEDYVTVHAPNATTGSTISNFGPPRTWGIQLNYAWAAE
jgi:iron complex outermembrane receptor protein